MEITMNESVRAYWEARPCGTSAEIVGDTPREDREWFERVEQYRYSVEPFIHSVAQFTLHHGETILEVGVGAGTDHLQWARAGARCHGVDLTEAGIEITRRRLGAYGFTSDLRRADAESLPFPDASFDLVYSWGVIHHSEHPEKIIKEIVRVLKPGGKFVGMMYGRRSLKVLTAWVWYALLRGRPWLSFSDVLARFVESPGTKAYTKHELRGLFSDFALFEAKPLLTIYDTRALPKWLRKFLPDDWGWFVALYATK
jgi:SAM-dependent methyltransferase